MLVFAIGSNEPEVFEFVHDFACEEYGVFDHTFLALGRVLSARIDQERVALMPPGASTYEVLDHFMPCSGKVMTGVGHRNVLQLQPGTRKTQILRSVPSRTTDK